ncbi:HDA2 [Candida oxycetoniae]|uniref:HDA2 n=1 Tax=Candida oxycetoniae TaxID=497107 RepID=A0AAI9T0B5_9ASCO|nr:HDA2 [Candida oxycetoniae]KAI3406259.2 HDA2 [Candida oxycetoniae]
MDMLSTDPPSSIYGNVDEYGLSNGGNFNTLSETRMSSSQQQQQGQEQQRINLQQLAQFGSKVFHIPTRLSRIQILIIQSLLYLFSDTLLNEMKARRKKSNIESLLQVSSIPSRDNSSDQANGDMEFPGNAHELVSLCFEKLAVVNNNPGLLVEHFIPKKLLLSETNELQTLMSGKYELFNKIIDSLISEKRDEVYSILVVAKNNKELELIEGIIIGKDLRYTNSSNIKLYDDKRKFCKDESREGGEGGEERGGGGGGGGGEEEGGGKGAVFVNLIQKQQLYNNYMNQSSSTSYKFVFSFDSDIDATNPSIEMLRSDSNCPIFIPVPIYSSDHLKLHIAKPRHGGFDEENELHEWRLKVLNTLVVNNFNLQEDLDNDFYYDNYGAQMKRFVSNIDQPDELVSLLAKYDDQLVLNYSEEKLRKKLSFKNDFSHFSKTGQKLSIENFSCQLSKLLQMKLIEIKEEVDHIEKIELPVKRKLETSRQVHFDEDENLIAENYPKFRRLTEEASFLDRKLSRFENDLKVKQDKLSELNDKISELNNKTKPDDGQITIETLSAQSRLITDLEKELSLLQSENQKVNNETETMRQKYQESSTEAVSQLNKLNQVKQQQYQKLARKLALPGLAQLPDLIHRDCLSNYQYKLTRLRARNKFLKSFLEDKIDKLCNERQQIMENSTSTGSSSRPSNRISRDSTPL